jgi:Xaa-Pro aminopeptidase
MNNRAQRFRERLADEQIDAALVTTGGNKRYLSGATGSGTLLVTAQRALLATDSRYWEQAAKQAPDFELVKAQGGMKDWLIPVLKETPVRTLAFEANNVSYAAYERLKSAIEDLPPGQRPVLKPSYDLTEGLRVYKDAEEMAVITRAVEMADHAFEAVAAALRPGVTERQVAWELEKNMREQGADGPSFGIIVASGPNAAMPHHRPTDRPIAMAEPIVIDMGARLHGYCSDLSRTVILGEPDAQFTKVYSIVLAAQETAIAAVQAGMTGHDADRLARDIIDKAGYGEQFGHGTGHGVGLDIHEDPWVSRNQDNVLRDGMVFTFEPGIYIPGWGGVRIEDMVVLEGGVSRDLTRAHKRVNVSV